MEAEKTHTDTKKILLYELQNIVKAIYPIAKTSNPYQEKTRELLEDYSISEQLLFKELLHVITLINQHGRLTDKKKILSSQTDILNTVELLHKQVATSNQKAIEAYYGLCKHYKNTPISLLDAQVYLRKSLTTTKRYFSILTKLHLLKKQSEKRGLKHLYKLIRKVDTEKESQSIFEQAFEEYQDYNGFTDLQYRT